MTLRSLKVIGDGATQGHMSVAINSLYCRNKVTDD